ncbi:MAG TPA: hypothetical protein DD420_23290 [Streptomyces sp.]|nr:hypothetical protein [Streptomyces sp.]
MDDYLAYHSWRRLDEAGPRVEDGTWSQEVSHVNQFYAWAQGQGHVAELPMPQRPRRLVPGLMRRSSAVLDTINHYHSQASCRGRSIGAALMNRARETARDEMNLEQLLRLAARGGIGFEDF